MKPIIKVENLSKRYKLGAQQKPYSTLRESLVEAVQKPFKAFQQNKNKSSADSSFWALQDINFQVEPGEVVGIIGRNGAGKSTLLKILSRITEPTKGKIELFGRVGSLLEVGTGFHAELSGRENIFLNGAILGMHRSEIARKFDEIVDFAEVEKFLDTPVKHYSSGMYTRLAFAVAANLEPDVLIVDEVLAVGDAEFQRKCLGKMQDISSHGRTVLFVSHNIKAIQQLCQKSILLDSGRVKMQGETSKVVQEYITSVQQAINYSVDKATITEINVFDSNGNKTNLWGFYEEISIEVILQVKEELLKPAIDIAFYTNNIRLFAVQSDKHAKAIDLWKGIWKFKFKIKGLGITVEQFHFDVGVRENQENYFLLVEEAKKMMPNYSTYPSYVLTDCILHPITEFDMEENI